jgi:colanic acid/amylovoran biosynthesis glycosyltransferase
MTMKPLNVAFFVGQFPILSETFVIRQVAGLVQAGHRVTVLAGEWGDRACAHENYRSNQLERTVRPLREGLGTRGGKLRRLAGFAAGSLLTARGWRRLAVALRATRNGSAASLLDIAAASTGPAGQRHLGRYDAVIAHFGQAGVRAMHLQQAGLLEGPLAVVFHGFDMSDRATLARHRVNYRDLFSHAALLLPISHLWRQRLVDWGARPEKIEVLRMGVDLDRLAMLSPARPLGTPLRVLSVARFTEKKGLRYAIEGVMAAQGPIRYEIIGTGPMADELKALAARAPADKQIVFLGQQSQQAVFAALEQADVFLLPSVTAAGGDMEGIPVSLMEAMAKGVLVLATEHSGIPELVAPNVAGFLVPERDSKAIAERIDGLRGRAHDLPQIRRQARQVVESEFDNHQLDGRLQRLCAAVQA